MAEIDHDAPQPALPVLGSVLLQNELKSRSRFSSFGATISTGCLEIDDHVLGGGGFERGIVVGINGTDEAGRLVAYNSIASVVISHLSDSPSPQQTALVIDISGNFSVELLSNIIRSRVLATLKARNPKADGNHDPNDLEEKVMKCLQMVDIDTVFDITGLWEVLGSIDGSAKENEIEVVFVDNLGVLINSLLSSSKTEAYDLLATLARALVRLSHDANILTILRTVALINNARSDKSNTPHLTSLFTSNTIKPALGTTFDQFTDLHLLVGSVPDVDDELTIVVEVLKDEAPNLSEESRALGAREQRWAPVRISNDGMGLVSAFVESGTMRGLGLERVSGRYN